MPQIHRGADILIHLQIPRDERERAHIVSGPPRRRVRGGGVAPVPGAGVLGLEAQLVEGLAHLLEVVGGEEGLLDGVGGARRGRHGAPRELGFEEVELRVEGGEGFGAGGAPEADGFFDGLAEGAEFLLVLCADLLGEDAVHVGHHGLELLLELGGGGLFALSGGEGGLVVLAGCLAAGGLALLCALGGALFGDAAGGGGALLGRARGEHDAAGLDLEHIPGVEQVAGVRHLLAIHLDQPVDAELAGLAHAAGEQGAEDGRVQAALRRVVGHLHVGRHGRGARLLQGVCAGAATGGLLAAVVAGQVLVVHGDDGGDGPLELPRPLLLADLLAVVRARVGLGGPFLLEEGAVEVGPLELRDAVQRPARHVLPDFLVIVSNHHRMAPMPVAQ